MSAENQALIFKKVPNGFPVPGQDLTVETLPFEASPPHGGLLVELLYTSFDPYLRGRMRDPSVKSYNMPFELNKPIDSGSVGKVLQSDNKEYEEGDLVLGRLPVQRYVAVTKDQMNTVRKLHNPLGIEDIRLFLGPLGMPGLTAYSSLYDIGKPKKGEVIFISAASGAVGAVVGQLAKREGLTVIGSVGSDEKLRYILEELGFDGGFNYKKEKPSDALARLAPDGIDIYYENVGGKHLAAALDAMRDFGRIVVCGMISQYNATEPFGICNLTHVVTKRLTIRGFIVTDANMGPKYAKEHQERVGQWIKEGTFKVLLDETAGVENAAEGLVGLFHGKNMGKAVLKW